MEVPRGLVQGGLCHLRHIVQEAVRGAVPQGRRGPCWGGRSRAGLLEVHVGEGLAEKVAGPRLRFLACYSNTNKDCIERYERGEVKRRFSKQTSAGMGPFYHTGMAPGENSLSRTSGSCGAAAFLRVRPLGGLIPSSRSASAHSPPRDRSSQVNQVKVSSSRKHEGHM